MHCEPWLVSAVERRLASPYTITSTDRVCSAAFNKLFKGASVLGIVRAGGKEHGMMR